MNALAKSAHFAAIFRAIIFSVPLLAAPPLFAQSLSSAPSGPTAALTSALSAACREDNAAFSQYLTANNAAAFRALSPNEQLSLMQRFVLLDAKGRPLLASTDQGRPLLRCEASDASEGFTLGPAEVHDHLAYIGVTTSNNDAIRFGLVSEDGNWKLLSIGLLLVDIPQLQKEWAAQQLKAHEQFAIQALEDLAQAIATYQSAFGKLPDTLAQLGPPAKGGVSPDAAKLIGPSLASGASNGYEFRYRVVTPAGSDSPGFEIAAVPQQYGKSGIRSFLLDKDGQFHAADKKGAVATTDDPLMPPHSDRSS